MVRMAQNLLYKILFNNASVKPHSIIQTSIRPSAQFIRLTSTSHASQILQDEENLKKNPYFKKYEDKIQVLKKEKPGDYLSRLQSTEALKPSEDPSQDHGSGSLLKSVSKQPPDPSAAAAAKVEAAPQPAAASGSLQQTRKLEDIVKLELLEDKSAAEISHIWREFHKNVEGLSSILSGEVFRVFQSRAKQYPVFLLPLPRREGYEFVVCQLERNLVQFTQLAAWQKWKEAAPPCMSLVYFPDLVETKGLALMRGAYDSASLSLLEAQCLANTLHLYYAEDNPKRTTLLDRFTHDPESFKHMDLVAELEQLGL